MKLKVIIYILLCSFFYSRNSIAQSAAKPVSISGKVVDAGGNPVEGVSILIQEKKTNTTTATDGSFDIQALSTDVLILKKMGFITAQQRVLDVKAITITMQPALIDAGDDDNVFIPFGVRKRRYVSASVSSVSGSELPKLPLSSLPNTLAGRLPGLYVQQTGSRPGIDDASFTIRGRSSYNSNQPPLILVDGIERSFDNMDVNEVESISVLKDAASISWYGMRGANGIIYVTTKRGNPSATRFTFDVQGGVQTPVYKGKTIDSYSYASLYNQARLNDGNSLTYTETQLEAYRTGADPIRFPNNNYSEMFLKDASTVQRYVATVSGGNAFAKYYVLLNHMNQNGLFDNSRTDKYKTNANYQKYNFRSNLDLHITKTLDATVDFGGRSEVIRYPASGVQTFMETINTLPPNAFPLRNEDGSYGGSDLFRNNPLAMLQSSGNINDQSRTLLATISARQKLNFLPGLSANALYSYDIVGTYQYGIRQTYEIFNLQTDGTYQRVGTAENGPIEYRDNTFGGNLRNNEFWFGFDYENTFGQHGLNFSTRWHRAVQAAPNVLENRHEGVSNRLSYVYKSRYFADFVAAYTGSERFAPGRRFGFFPAVSAGWIVSDEGFFKPASTVLNYLKLRASYGIVGSDDMGVRRGAFNDFYNRTGTGYNFGTSYTAANGATEISLSNPFLTWEKAKKASVGFDARLLKQALSLSFDYFNEDRDDLLTTDLSPRVVGIGRIQVNKGKANYKGYETGLNYVKNINKFTLILNGNFTHVASKILALNEAPGLPSYQSEIGRNVGRLAQFNREGDVDYQRMFLISDGLFRTQEEINNAPFHSFGGGARIGDIRYKDMNNDNRIDASDMVASDYADMPRSYYGFGVALKYKGFDLSANFQGVEGRTVSIANIVNSGTNNNGYINQFSSQRWTPETAETAIYPRLSISNRANNTQASDFWLRSGDYMRLKVAELGYSCSPESMLRKTAIRSLRFYLTGFNLLTFSSLNKLDIDPEMPTSGYNASYPYVRTFSAGLNLTF